ncbi:MAG: hypothetical protein ACJ72N_07580 [Labedaea sp.]
MASDAYLQTRATARLRVWDDSLENSADTMQRVMLDFCRAPSVPDDHGGFSKLIAQPTLFLMRKFACCSPVDVPLPSGDWPTLKCLICDISDSVQAYRGHYLLRTYFDACDAILFWLDSAPEYVPVPGD